MDGRVSLRNRMVTVFRACKHPEEVPVQAGVSDAVFLEFVTRESEQPCRECRREALAAATRDPEAVRCERATLWPE